MKFRKPGTKKILAICLVLVLISAGIFFEINAPANNAHATGISSQTTYYLPTSSNDPWGTAFDRSGNVWVALPGCDFAPKCSSSTPPGRLSLFNSNTHSWVTTVSLPAGFGQPIFVAVAPDGRVWFTMPVTNTLGVYNPTTTTVTQWAVPTPSAGPWGIAIDSTGKIWFTEHYGNQIGSFDPTSQTFQEIATPATNSNPYGITVDAANNIWFTENTDAVALIGEYTAQGSLREYKIRNTPTAGTGLTPHEITVAPNGNIWWSEGWVSAVGTLNVSAAVPGTNNGVTEYFYTHCNGCGSHTSGISADQQGLIWVDDSLLNQYGYIPATGGSFTFYATPGNHPHDGLNVDSQNRVWFNEEFSNAIVLAIPSGGSTTPAPTPTPTNTPGVTPTSASTPATTPTTTGTWTTQASDTFQRANQTDWGTASDGHVWGGDANSQNVFSVAGNAGLVSNTGGTSYSAVLGNSMTDSEVYATISMNSFTNGNFGDVLRWTDGNNWYKAYIDGVSLVIQKKVAGATTVLTTVPFAATAGTAYTIHFRVTGATLNANVWASSGSEPGGWMATATDTSLTSGFSGLRFLTQSATATVTSVQINAPGASGTPTPTPTPGVTPTPTPTPGITPTVGTTPTPTPGVTPTVGTGATLATDTFQRPNQSHWGTASDGQTWGGDANIQSAFSISGNTGRVTTNGSSYSAVLGPATANAEVYLTGSLSSFANSNFGGVLRWTDGNNWYKAYIDGTSLIIQKKVNGSTTVVATVPFAATAGTSYTIHFRVVGSTLSASAWASSGSEPANWMATATDTSLTTGYCGLRVLTQSGTLTVTSFVAKQD